MMAAKSGSMSRSLPPWSPARDGGMRKSTVTVPRPVIAQRWRVGFPSSFLSMREAGIAQPLGERAVAPLVEQRELEAHVEVHRADVRRRALGQRRPGRRERRDEPADHDDLVHQVAELGGDVEAGRPHELDLLALVLGRSLGLVSHRVLQVSSSVRRRSAASAARSGCSFRSTYTWTGCTQRMPSFSTAPWNTPASFGTTSQRFAPRGSSRKPSRSRSAGDGSVGR